MRARRKRRTERMRTLLHQESGVHLLFEYVSRPDGSWVALCGMPEAQAAGATYPEARERLRLAMVEVMGSAAVRAATLVEDVPFGALEEDMAY